MTRDDILACLRYFGFDDLRVGLEAPDHGGGPSFAVAALRTRSDDKLQSAAAAFSSQAIVAEDATSTENGASLLLNDSFTRPPAQSEFEQLRQHVKALEAAAQLQDRYIKALESEIQRKNDHIADQERLIKRVEAGRLLRLLRRISW
jgi:hypothetical protein